MKKKLLKWIKLYGLNIGNNVTFRKDPNGRRNCYIVTDAAEYCITVNKQRDYLGGIRTCRFSRPGENWLRGSDLPDGKYDEATLKNIMLAIVKHEGVTNEDSNS